MVHQFAIRVVKRWQTVDHFIYQDSQRPPVYTLSVWLEVMKGEKLDQLANNLRSKILGSAAEGMRSISLDSLFREAKVCYADVTFEIQNEILRLQVTVDDVVAVEMTNSHCNFCSVKLGPTLQ